MRGNCELDVFAWPCWTAENVAVPGQELPTFTGPQIVAANVVSAGGIVGVPGATVRLNVMTLFTWFAALMYGDVAGTFGMFAVGIASTALSAALFARSK